MTFDDLILWARGYTMTPQECEAQRRSFEIGQLMLDHPEMTRERAAEIVESVLKGSG